MEAVAPIAGSLIGGIMGSDAADSAASTQAAAADRATEEQRRQYDLNRQDMAPFRDTGVSALNRLAYLMGIGGTSGISTTGATSSGLTEAQIREQLLPQYTTSGDAGQIARLRQQIQHAYAMTDESGRTTAQDLIDMYQRQLDGLERGTVDESALSAAVAQQMSQQQAQQAAAQAAASGDPAYGSLLRRFAMSDYEEDPGYQFRLQQGEQAINRAAAAAGRYDSGRAMKDLNEFNSGLASQEYQNAYNRWNNDNTNIFNRLSGVAGTGQTATNQLAAYGTNMANNVASNTLQAGNARASGYMGQANAWGNALGGATNALAGYFQPSYNVGSQFSLNNGFRSSIANPSFSASF